MIEVFELPFAVREYFRSSPEHIRIQPALSADKRFESLDGFQSAIQVRIVQLNEIGIFRTARNFCVCKQLDFPFFDIEQNLLSYRIM